MPCFTSTSSPRRSVYVWNVPLGTPKKQQTKTHFMFQFDFFAATTLYTYRIFIPGTQYATIIKVFTKYCTRYDVIIAVSLFLAIFFSSFFPLSHVLFFLACSLVCWLARVIIALHCRSPRWSINSGYPRILLALVLEFDAHRGEILKKDQLLRAPTINSSVGRHNSTRVDEGRKS